jgi:large subunit ribosomal protein L17
MKHHNNIRKLGRTKDTRNALMRSLAQSLIKNERIKTTEAKAKELRPYVEKLITSSREETLASKRSAVATLGIVEGKKIIDDVAPRYKDRNGGYTRISKLPRREGDGAKMAIIELV